MKLKRTRTFTVDERTADSVLDQSERTGISPGHLLATSWHAALPHIRTLPEIVTVKELPIFGARRLAQAQARREARELMEEYQASLLRNVQ